MKSILEPLYKCIMHTTNEPIPSNRCVICLEPLKFDSQMRPEAVEHFQQDHVGLCNIIWNLDYDYGNPYPVLNSLLTNRQHSNTINNCFICYEGTGESGIVEHYSQKHPFIIRFLNNCNIKVK